MSEITHGEVAAPRFRLFRRVGDAIGMSVGVAAFVTGVLVSADVVGRSLFRLSNSWITEVTTYLLAYITFVGAPYALREGAHVGVDLLIALVPPRARRLLAALTSVAMVLIVGCLAWLSFVYFRDAWVSGERSESLLSIRLWIPYLSFFLGMLWLLLVTVEMAVAAMLGLFRQSVAH